MNYGKPFPRLKSAFAAARTLAWGVAAGLLDYDTVKASLLQPREVRATPAARLPLLWTLNEAIEQFERDRHIAQRAVSKAIGGLIDAHADAEEIAQAADEADPTGLLTPSEITRVIAREQAWWVRLHAALQPEARHAA